MVYNARFQELMDALEEDNISFEENVDWMIVTGDISVVQKLDGEIQNMKYSETTHRWYAKYLWGRPEAFLTSIRNLFYYTDRWMGLLLKMMETSWSSTGWRRRP